MGSVSKMVSFVKEWCADDSHGYSQNNRWGPDCDCSSLMYMAAAHAGYDVPTSGTRYTRTMVRDFTAAGFQAVPFDGGSWAALTSTSTAACKAAAKATRPETRCP